MLQNSVHLDYQFHSYHYKQLWIMANDDGVVNLLFCSLAPFELSSHVTPCHATVLLCCHTVYRMGVYACLYGRQHLCHCFFGEAGSLHVSDVLCLCEWERAPGQINLWTQQCQDHGERGVCSLEALNACMFSAPPLPLFNFLSTPSSCMLAWLRSDSSISPAGYPQFLSFCL